MKKEYKDIFFLRPGMVPILLMIVILFPIRVFASVAGEVNKAVDLYKRGQFDDSLKLYQQALDQDGKSSIIKYDLGTAFYKKGDYAKALEYLQQVQDDKSLKIKPKAEYNLGNVLYKSGIQKEKTNLDQALKNLQEALGYYGQTLQADPKDQDAQFNQDFVKKEIQRLKQKKQEQQQNQQQQQGQQKQQEQKSQQNQQGQQNQQNQQNQQKQKDSQQAQQENAQEQKNKQQPSGAQAQKQQKAQAQSAQSQKELDRKQAQDLLEDYQENEEPKKFLNYMPKKVDDRPVLKDW